MLCMREAEIECRVERTVLNTRQTSFLLHAWSYLLLLIHWWWWRWFLLTSWIVELWKTGNMLLVPNFSVTATVNNFILEKLIQVSLLVWHEMFYLKKSKQSFLADVNCCLVWAVLDAMFNARSLDTRLFLFIVVTKTWNDQQPPKTT